jgi:hypothetical protein
MGRAAQDAAAKGQAGLGAHCATDLAALAWVLAALLGQLGGVMPTAPPLLLGSSAYMDWRTVTSLHHAGSL